MYFMYAKKITTVMKDVIVDLERRKKGFSDCNDVTS